MTSREVGRWIEADPSGKESARHVLDNFFFPTPRNHTICLEPTVFHRSSQIPPTVPVTSGPRPNPMVLGNKLRQPASG